MGRRARVERDHDRAAPPAARVPRDPRRGDDAALRERAARATASGRALGDLLGRRARPGGHARVLRGAAPGRARCRRRASRGRAALLRGARGHRRRARLHAHLARALRALALGRDPADSAGARPHEALDAALRLRLRVLGPPDGRSAHGRPPLPARAQPAAGAGVPRAQPRRRAAEGRRQGSSATGRSPGTRGSACSRAGSAPSRMPSAGSSTARSSTARGAGSSRPGCGR